MVFVEHANSRQWGYYDRFSDIKKLVESLDLRGKRENAFARALRQSWLGVLEKHMVTHEKARESALNQLAGIRDEAQLAREEAEVQEEIDQAVANIEPLELDARIWGTAKSPEEREYYYHKDTRETTWDIPEALAKLREAKAEIEELKTKKADVRVPKSGEGVRIDDSLSLALIRRMSEYAPGKAVDEGELRSNARRAQVLRFKYRSCELLASVMTLEAMTIGPESKPNLSPKKSEWIGSGKDREAWLGKAEEVKKQIAGIEVAVSLHGNLPPQAVHLMSSYRRMKHT